MSSKTSHRRAHRRTACAIRKAGVPFEVLVAETARRNAEMIAQFEAKARAEADPFGYGSEDLAAEVFGLRSR